MMKSSYFGVNESYWLFIRLQSSTIKLYRWLCVGLSSSLSSLIREWRQHNLWYYYQLKHLTPGHVPYLYTYLHVLVLHVPCIVTYLLLHSLVQNPNPNICSRMKDCCYRYYEHEDCRLPSTIQTRVQTVITRDKSENIKNYHCFRWWNRLTLE
jgi:hypothetical protein